MALRVFEARPDRVQVGNSGTAEFDSDRQYVYSSSGSTIKFTNDPTIVISGANLTYRFDGGNYYINSNPSFTVNVENLSVG
jgi:hypothetical protein